LLGLNERSPHCTLPLVSHGEYANETDRQTDRQTDGWCQTVTLCFPLYTADVSVLSAVVMAVAIARVHAVHCDKYRLSIRQLPTLKPTQLMSLHAGFND